MKMVCKKEPIEREQIIARYLSRSLNEEGVEEFEAHYLGCDECFDEMRVSARLAADLRASTLAWKQTGGVSVLEFRGNTELTHSAQELEELRREVLEQRDSRDLILAADGELHPLRAAELQKHLEICAECRERDEELRAASAEFAGVHQCTPLPPASAARARLQTTLMRGLTSVTSLDHAARLCAHRSPGADAPLRHPWSGRSLGTEKHAHPGRDARHHHRRCLPR